MQVTADDLTRIERLHVRAWPALESADINGWLWRYSGGGSKRANSVSTVDFSGNNPMLALDEVEARYRARNATAQVHTYDLSAPTAIAELLQGRGYGISETTLTMAKTLGLPSPSADVEVAAVPTAEWREVYLGAISESRAGSMPKFSTRCRSPAPIFPATGTDGSYRLDYVSPIETSPWWNAWRRVQKRAG